MEFNGNDSKFAKRRVANNEHSNQQSIFDDNYQNKKPFPQQKQERIAANAYTNHLKTNFSLDHGHKQNFKQNDYPVHPLGNTPKGNRVTEEPNQDSGLKFSSKENPLPLSRKRRIVKDNGNPISHPESDTKIRPAITEPREEEGNRTFKSSEEFFLNLMKNKKAKTKISYAKITNNNFTSFKENSINREFKHDKTNLKHAQIPSDFRVYYAAK